MIDDKTVIRKMQSGYTARISKSRLVKTYPWEVQLKTSMGNIYEVFRTWHEASETLKSWHEGKVRE